GLVAQAAAAALIQSVGGLAGGPQPALVRSLQQAQHVQQRALARARSIDDCDHFVGMDRQADVAQDLDPPGPLVVGLGQALGAQYGVEGGGISHGAALGRVAGGMPASWGTAWPAGTGPGTFHRSRRCRPAGDWTAAR